LIQADNLLTEIRIVSKLCKISVRGLRELGKNYNRGWFSGWGNWQC